MFIDGNSGKWWGLDKFIVAELLEAFSWFFDSFIHVYIYPHYTLLSPFLLMLNLFSLSLVPGPINCPWVLTEAWGFQSSPPIIECWKAQLHAGLLQVMAADVISWVDSRRQRFITLLSPLGLRFILPPLRYSVSTGVSGTDVHFSALILNTLTITDGFIRRRDQKICIGMSLLPSLVTECPAVS